MLANRKCSQRWEAVSSESLNSQTAATSQVRNYTQPYSAEPEMHDIVKKIKIKKINLCSLP